MVVLVLVTFFAEILERGSGQLLSPTIPTVLTTHSSPPLSAFRCKKRMLSQKERAESEVLAWRQALYCKEKNAVMIPCFPSTRFSVISARDNIFACRDSYLCQR